MWILIPCQRTKIELPTCQHHMTVSYVNFPPILVNENWISHQQHISVGQVNLAPSLVNENWTPHLSTIHDCIRYVNFLSNLAYENWIPRQQHIISLWFPICSPSQTWTKIGLLTNSIDLQEARKLDRWHSDPELEFCFKFREFPKQHLWWGFATWR